MADRVAEAALKALFAVLQGAAPSGAGVWRNEPLPVDMPDNGLMILTDGDPGDPEETMSPHRYHFEHVARLEVLVEGSDAVGRDAAFDSLVQSVGAAIRADRTLGGACEWCEPRAPETIEIAVDGSAPMKAATVDIVMHYTTADPLA